MKKRESPDFRFPEVDISVIMSKSRGGTPPRGLVPLRVLKPKMTAARVVLVRFMTILSKSSWEGSVQKLCFLLLKFAMPVMKFVVVELVPLRGGNEFRTRP